MLDFEKLEEIKSKVFTKYPKSEFQIESYYYKPYRDTHNILRLIVKTRFGLCDVLYSKIMMGRTPSIVSSVDKVEYASNMLKEYHPSVKNIVVENVYGKNRKNITVIKKDGFCFEIPVQKVNKTLYFSIENVTEKDKYILYLLNKYNEHIIKGDIKLKKGFRFTKTNVKVDVETKYGDCKIIMSDLLLGKGVNIRSAIEKTEYFKNMVKERYPDYSKKYDLSKLEYISHNTPIELICKIHGSFKTSPNSVFTLGVGCKKCGHILTAEFGKNNPVGWGYTVWQKAGEKSKNFDSFKVYIIKCWNDEEEFYKIGKTFQKIKLRFRTSFKSKIPYNYELIKIFESKTDGLYISKLEKELQKLNKDNKYLPKIEFVGMHECFKTVDYEL